MELYSFVFVFLVTFVLNWTAVGMMAVAFGIVIRRGGWEAAMRAHEGPSLARWLLASGAGLGVVTCYLYLLLYSYADRLLN